MGTPQHWLRHRATVERATTTFADGVPVLAWHVVGARVPVLLSATESQHDPTWEPTQQRESDRRGLLLTMPEADVRPGDRVYVTRPAMAGSFEILPDPSMISTLHTAHHREHHVRQVSSEVAA